MKQTFIFLILAIPLLCMAQNLPREYHYDAAGNRVLRKVVESNPQLTPAPPPDSTEYSESPPLVPEYYVEKIAQVEIKIFPNPTTEKITLQISNMEKLQTGIFKLFSMNGQLLQDHPVHSETTIISLATLPKGAYILKVLINDRAEDWKVIKN